MLLADVETGSSVQNLSIGLKSHALFAMLNAALGQWSWAVVAYRGSCPDAYQHKLSCLF